MIRVMYKDVAPNAKEGMTALSSPLASFGDVTEIEKDGISPPEVATLEAGRWLLDGSLELMSGGDFAIWSEGILGETAFGLTLGFDTFHKSTGLTVYFYGDAWGKSVAVRWLREGTVVAEGIFEGVGDTLVCVKEVSGYDKIEIDILSMSLGGRYVKISGVDIGLVRVFGEDELESVSVYEEVALSSEQLASGRLNVTIRSGTDTPYLFQERQQIAVEKDGESFGTFYLDTGTRLSASRYRIEAVDAVGVLAESDFLGGMYFGVTASELIGEVLNGVRFTARVLEDRELSGLISITTRRDALSQIAISSGLCVSCARESFLRFFVPPSELKVIGENRVFSSEVESNAPATAVVVTAHTYEAQEGAVTAFSGVLSGGGNVVRFTEPLHSLTVSGGVIEDSGANFARVTGSGGTVRIVGKVYGDSLSQVVARDEVTEALETEKVIRIEGATLISADNAAEVARRVYENYHSRNAVTARILLEGERVGDMVEIATPWHGVIVGRIESLDITLGDRNVATAVIRY